MSFSGDRLRERRKALKLNQHQLGELVGLSQGAISDLERGTALETTKLLELARVCGVTPDWLLGKDPKSPTITAVVEDQTTGRMTRVPVSSRPTEGFDLRNIREIEIRGGASYGGGIGDEAWQDGDTAGDKPTATWGLPAAFIERELGLQAQMTDILRIHGDSMDDGSAKSLSSGDRVIVDRFDVDIRQGGVFAVFDGEGVIIKQVELIRGHTPPRIICKSRNDRYDPIPLILESPVRVIGRIAGRISRM